jgi:hypothetical protein
MIRHAKKITALTGATLLSLGLAAPAFAQTIGAQDTVAPTIKHAKTTHTVTVESLRTRLTNSIDKRLARIEMIRARVTGSTRRTDQQKADVLTRIQTAQDSLAALRTTVATATTTDEIRAAVKAARLRGLLFTGHRHGHHARHHRNFGAGAANGHKHAATKADSADAPVVRQDRSATAPSNVSSDHSSVRTLPFRHDGARHHANRATNRKRNHARSDQPGARQGAHQGQRGGDRAAR